MPRESRKSGIEEAALPELLERLRAAGIAQAVALSTCDRIEVQAVHDAAAAASDRIAEVLADQAGVAPAALAEQAYRLSGAAAVRHILAVAASLDSLVVGEPQVLGQVKAGHRLARAAGMVGSELEACLQAAYATAKRVRRETAIGERAVSIAAAAAELARSVQGDLGRCGALLIGAGEIGELMVEQLRRAGLARLTVAHPSAPRAERIAHRLGCHHITLDEIAATGGWSVASALLLGLSLGAVDDDGDHAAAGVALDLQLGHLLLQALLHLLRLLHHLLDVHEYSVLSFQFSVFSSEPPVRSLPPS